MPHAAAISAGCDGPALAPALAKTAAKRVDGATVYVTGRLDVDADGAPDSYRVDGKGLSFTCDGVVARDEHGNRITSASDARWQDKCLAAWKAAKLSGDYRKVAIFGFATAAGGGPLVQRTGDPLPELAYVSTTTMAVPGTPDRTQRHYVDARQIPYVVLPGEAAAANGIALGTVAAVLRVKTGRLAFAVFADTGGQPSEASVRLHEDLGGKPVVVVKGVARAKVAIDDERIVFALFPMVQSPARSDAAAWRSEIAERGAGALAAWGGHERLAACAR